MVIIEGDIAETGREEQLSGFFRKRSVNFHVETTIVEKYFLSDAGDGTIKAQRVVVGDEEGEMWFVLKDRRLHFCRLAGANVRRVGCYNCKFIVEY